MERWWRLCRDDFRLENSGPVSIGTSKVRNCSEPHVTSDTVVLISFVALSEVVAVLCAIWLWRHERSWARCIGWSLALALPLLGPLLYGGLYGRPERDDFPPPPTFNPYENMDS